MPMCHMHDFNNVDCVFTDCMTQEKNRKIKRNADRTQQNQGGPQFQSNAKAMRKRKCNEAKETKQVKKEPVTRQPRKRQHDDDKDAEPKRKRKRSKSPETIVELLLPRTLKKAVVARNAAMKPKPKPKRNPPKKSTFSTRQLRRKLQNIKNKKKQQRVVEKRKVIPGYKKVIVKKEKETVKKGKEVTIKKEKSKSLAKSKAKKVQRPTVLVRKPHPLRLAKVSIKSKVMTPRGRWYCWNVERNNSDHIKKERQSSSEDPDERKQLVDKGTQTVDFSTLAHLPLPDIYS
ncbi:DNA ligase 1-like [Drosophila tropicalis]|uniref:DNA ligase 1-like n=1 Tax=Drosophila tropicalis TaxID=46794 RepID=UPI0035ABA2DD